MNSGKPLNIGHWKRTPINSIYFRQFICRCELCGKSCPSQRRLKEHINEKHLYPQEKVDCDQCSKQFDSKKLLDQHILRSHVAESEKIYKCDQCGRRYVPFEFDLIRQLIILRMHFIQHLYIFTTHLKISVSRVRSF